jgi:hypothetical protein
VGEEDSDTVSESTADGLGDDVELIETDADSDALTDGVTLISAVPDAFTDCDSIDDGDGCALWLANDIVAEALGESLRVDDCEPDVVCETVDVMLGDIETDALADVVCEPECELHADAEFDKEAVALGEVDEEPHTVLDGVDVLETLAVGDRLPDGVKVADVEPHALEESDGDEDAEFDKEFVTLGEVDAEPHTLEDGVVELVAQFVFEGVPVDVELTDTEPQALGESDGDDDADGELVNETCGERENDVVHDAVTDCDELEVGDVDTELVSDTDVDTVRVTLVDEDAVCDSVAVLEAVGHDEPLSEPLVDALPVDDVLGEDDTVTLEDTDTDDVPVVDEEIEGVAERLEVCVVDAQADMEFSVELETEAEDDADAR